MKKLKGLLLVLFASVMAFSFSACSSCSSDNSGSNNPEEPVEEVTDTRKPASVSVDTTNVKTLYYVGSDIDLTGLVINVTYDDGTSGTVEDGATGLIIDTSMYKSNTVGTYTIYVYYTLNSTRKYTTFPVEVTDEQNSVQFDITAATTEYTLEKDTLESVDLSSITPTVVLDGETLGTSAYTIKYYSGDTELTSATDLTVTAGVYQIWAYVEDYYDDLTGKNYDLSTFVLIYVLDPVVSIAENGNGTYTQVEGTDSISSTWEYTATYSSGDTATILASDVDVDIDTATVATEATATVTYSEDDLKGNEHEVTCTVTYTITERVVSGTETYTMNYVAGVTDSSTNAGAYSTTWADNSEDTSGLVTITNTASTFKNKSKTASDGSTYSDYAEIKAYSSKSITITVAEGATDVSITVYTSHTSSDARTLYLSTSTDSTVTASIIGSVTVGGTGESTSDLQIISGTDLSDGSYYVYSDGNTMHVYAVVVTYSIVASNEYTMNYTASVTDSSTNAGAYTTTWADNSEDTSGLVTVTNTASTFKTKEKSASDGSTYSAYSEIKAYSGKSITITVGEGVTDVSITVYTSHTSSDARTLYLSTSTDSTVTASIIGSVTVGGTGESTSDLQIISGTDLSSGTYYIYSDGNTMHVYAVVVTYTLASSASSEDVEINMGTTFTNVVSGTTGTINSGSEIVEGSGIYVGGGTSDGTTEISSYTLEYSQKALTSDSNTKYDVRLKFAGGIHFDASSSNTANTVGNGLCITTEGAATITVYVRSSNNSQSRTVALYDDTGTVVGESLTTNEAGTIDVFTVEVSAAGTYFFGSAEGGIGIYYVAVNY